MPSTRKQRAKERRSRQADIMSDVKNLDVMLGSYSSNELVSNSEDRNVKVDLGLDRSRQDVTQNVEDYRSVFKFNSRENSEKTLGAVRLDW